MSKSKKRTLYYDSDNNENVRYRWSSIGYNDMITLYEDREHYYEDKVILFETDILILEYK